MAKHTLGALALMVSTLWVGMAGYHWLEGLSWIDAYLNAAGGRWEESFAWFSNAWAGVLEAMAVTARKPVVH